MGRTKREPNYTTGTFADRLSDLVNEKKKEGLQQKDVAKELGVSSAILSYWCNDEKTVSADNLVKLAKYFDVSADWLLGLSDARTPDDEIQQVQKYTGLSEGAIVALHFRNNPLTQHLNDFHSAFIANLEILGMLSYCPGKILKIQKDGLTDREENILESKEVALDFYRFQMQQSIMRFIDRYFENMTLEEI